MSLAESMLPEFDEEMAATRQALERVPEGKSSWKPHPKSMPLGRLATLLAEMPQWVVNTLSQDELDVPMPFVPSILESRAKILALFDQNVKAARAALARVPDAAWARPWTLKFGGQAVFTRPKGMVYRRDMMNHVVHHRGQLTVYLRLNGVPVPGIYGRSADE